MKYFIYIFCTIILVVLQTTILCNFTAIKIIPDLIFVFVLGLCLIKNYNEAMVVSITGGLLLDIFSAKSFGLTALALIVIVIITYYLTQTVIDTEKKFSKLWITVISSFVYFSIILGLSIIFDVMDLSSNKITLSAGLLYSLIGGVTLNTLIILPMTVVTKFIKSYIERFEKRREIVI